MLAVYFRVEFGSPMRAGWVWCQIQGRYHTIILDEVTEADFLHCWHYLCVCMYPGLNPSSVLQGLISPHLVLEVAQASDKCSTEKEPWVLTVTSSERKEEWASAPMDLEWPHEPGVARAPSPISGGEGSSQRAMYHR